MLLIYISILQFNHQRMSSFIISIQQFNEFKDAEISVLKGILRNFFTPAWFLSVTRAGKIL